MSLAKKAANSARCIRLVPYDIDGKVLLDIQQVLPLAEAADYQVRLRRKDVARERARSDGRDFTRYHIVVDGVEQPHQNKRNAIRTMVEELAGRGAPLASRPARARPTIPLPRTAIFMRPVERSSQQSARRTAPR